jgi:hypothetical protein
MASDTWGKVSATRFRNTVNESKMVTPATEHSLNRATDGGVSGKIKCLVGVRETLVITGDT